MRREGLSYRTIQRLTGVNHNTVINWVKELELLNSEEISEEDKDMDDNHFGVKANCDFWIGKTWIQRGNFSWISSSNCAAPVRGKAIEILGALGCC